MEWFGHPPQVQSAESYAPKPDGPRFDHTEFDELLRRHVSPDGLVDYQAIKEQPRQLDQYLDRLAQAPFEDLGRDEKLALLINAYNAFTIRLIIEHYPVDSIRNIPADDRWEARRWNVGGKTWSLNEIEHQQVRPHFKEPRIHFAMVCAARGCPPLRTEAYLAEKLDAQLQSQAEYVHAHPRWFEFDAERGLLKLTRLYQWHSGDFIQEAGPVQQFASRYSPTLRDALKSGRDIPIEFLDYDWSLNEISRERPLP